MRENIDRNVNDIGNISHFSPEIRYILFAIRSTAYSHDTISFFEHMSNRVDQIFQDCNEPSGQYRGVNKE